MRKTLTRGPKTPVLGTADGGRRRIDAVTIGPHGGCPYLELKVEGERGGREYQLAGPAAVLVVREILRGLPPAYLATDPVLLTVLGEKRNAAMTFLAGAKAT